MTSMAVFIGQVGWPSRSLTITTMNSELSVRFILTLVSEQNGTVWLKFTLYQTSCSV